MTHPGQDWLDDCERFDKGAFVTVSSSDTEYTDFDLTKEQLQAVFTVLAEMELSDRAKGTIMERIKSVTYSTSRGPVMLKKVGADWIVSNLHTGVDVGFSTVSKAMAYIRMSHGWPLQLATDES